MLASRPAPGVGPPGSVVDVVFGTTVVVVTPPSIGAEPTRHTSWYLSLSAPFVVEPFASIWILPLLSSPLSFGPTIGTTRSTGAEHTAALDGSPIAATAASSPLVSSFFFPFFALN